MNKAEKSLRWVVNQIPDFKPTTNEEKMLVAIKLYSEAGAEEIKRLEAENAALRERAERSVELKARVGDVIYIPWINDGKDAVAELPINKISVHKDNFVLYWVDLSKCDKDYMWATPKLHYTHSDLGSVVFLTREAAEARLAELKGEKG